MRPAVASLVRMAREMLSYALYATKAFDTRVLEKFG